MNRLAQILGAATELKDRHSLGDQFRGTEPDNLCTQQFVSLWIRQDFAKP